MTTTTPRTTGQRLILRLLLLILVGASVGIASVTSAPPAAAAITDGWDPSLIISDSIFYDSTTMSASDIQVFLNREGASCTPGPDGTPCLKDFRQDTVSRSASTQCPGGYVGAAGESAATIISKVAGSCGINPQVILVTLQKEQGLIKGSGSGLYANRYRSAMGYGCPDSAACDSQYYGFFNQVYSAASQFRNYALNPTRYSHRAGVVTNIRINPNAACGTTAVLIQNQATAGLYNYTPYQPNAAALAAGFGTGDACSSYGNRNFWLYFRQWFGPTTQRAPIGTFDSVSSTPSSVTVGGWTLDPDTTSPISVHVFIDGGWVGAGSAAIPRADVAAAYGKGEQHGYLLTVPATQGTHRICTVAVDSAGGLNTELGCKVVNVVNQRPVGVVDNVSTTLTSITASGWVLDPDTSEPISVHIFVDGGWAGATTAATPRADVAAAFGKGEQHGYQITVPATSGPHRVCLYAVDANGGLNLEVGCRNVTVVNRAPVGTVDGLSVTGSTASISGWAFDPDTDASIGVHFYLDGQWATAVTAASPRSDVNAVYGIGGAHGFQASFPVTVGTHSVCAYGIDATGGPNPALGCRTFTIAGPQQRKPVGVVDGISTTTSGITVTGWAFDPDTSDSIAVHVFVDGGWAGATAAANPRADVSAAYGIGGQHGYQLTVPAATGTHRVCAVAVDSAGGMNSEIGCRTVAVTNRAPVGALDGVITTGATVTAFGWAFDPDSAGSIGVHFYLDGGWATAVTADAPRADVGSIYGVSGTHGYQATFTATAGTHTLCAYGIDSDGGTNSSLGCRTVTITG